MTPQTFPRNRTGGILAGVLGLLLLAGLLLGPVRTWVRERRRDRIFAAGRLSRQKKLDQAPSDADPDAAVKLKSMNPTSLEDERSLKGRALWVSAGGQLDYYPSDGRSVDFSHREGVLSGAQKILVEDVVEQLPPSDATSHIPRGDAQLFLLFSRDGDSSLKGRRFAVAVGDREAGEYDILTDQLFYYDDPHSTYAYWGPAVWKAIDEHRPMIGMTRRQMHMALGQSKPHGDIMGDRTEEFDDNGRPKLVTFIDGKAAKIQDLSK